MPEVLNQTFFLMPHWKWLALVLTLLAGFLLKWVLNEFLQKAKSWPKITDKSHRVLQLFIAQKIETSFSWIAVLLFWKLAVELTEIQPSILKVLSVLFQATLAFHMIRLAYLAMEAFGQWLEEHVTKTDNTLDDQIAPFATKVLKVLILIIGGLAVLQNFGVNVFSILAGLGLGGLALTLAAQDTAANVFGSIQIIFDRPFKKGDYVKISDIEGIVEEVGFRSTRIRTFYDSVVSIPNATVAKEKVDNLGLRQVRRVRHILGLTYETPEDKMKLFIEKLQVALHTHPLVEKETITVRLHGLGDFSLQILLQFYVKTDDIVIEREIQQEILFACLSLAKESGVEYAYPTQTHYLRN
jgi:MscS family membrane protein